MARATDESEQELFVDKEGIPHWDGENIALFRKCQTRVAIEYNTQSGSRRLARRSAPT